MLEGVKSVTAGALHFCFLTRDGALFCMGSDVWGQLGNDRALKYSFDPVRVANLGKVVAASAAAFKTCAVETTGTVRCWGKNESGEFGPNVSAGYYETPAPIEQLDDSIGDMK